MLRSKRKDKKNLKKGIIKLLLVIAVLIFAAISGYVFYLAKIRKPLYISPLAKGFSVSRVSGTDQELSILKTGLLRLHIDVDSITSSNEAYLVQLKDKSQIIFSEQKNIDSQISSLQFILTRLTMEGKGFNQLDLRFDKPVVRLKSL